MRLTDSSVRGSFPQLYMLKEEEGNFEEDGKTSASGEFMVA